MSYIIAGHDGGEYSADPRDYWDAPDRAALGGALVRVDHRYVTRTGRIIHAPRVLVCDATVGHLRRIDSARKGCAR